MKIHVISDIHLEFGQFDYVPPKCDVAVLAGDIGVGQSGVEWAKEIFPSTTQIIYVAGNHEFYNQKFDYTEFMNNFSDNFHFLQQSEFLTRDNFVIIGATLWTDMCLYGDPVTVPTFLNDFNLIETNEGKWTPEKMRIQHDKDKIAIEKMLKEAKENNRKCVVVTHHAPHELSCADIYKGNKMNPLFMSNLESFIIEHSPVLWIHGHCHNSSDYMVGDTRVVCNPKGYRQENKEFNPNFIVEV